MGAYLSEPITSKETTTEENEFMSVASCSMQGWRVSQEDAHNAILKYDTDSSLFAVYDGHGGHEVAKYCASNLPNFIKKNEDYRNGNIDKALVDSFVEFDKTLVDRKVVNELKKIAGTECDEEDEHDPAEVDHLYQEATMPIEEVVAKYGRGEEEVDANGDTKPTKNAESSSKKPLTHPAIAELSKKGRKPISPYLRAKTVSRIGATGSGAEQDETEMKEVKSEVKEEVKSEVKEEVKSEVKSESETPEIKTEVEIKTESEEDSKPNTTDNSTNVKTTNGHAENGDAKLVSEDSEKPVLVNGDSNNAAVSVKGKGKGKGKSSMSKLASTADASLETEVSKPVPAAKKKAKSAEELYKHVLVADSDCDDEDLDDEEDENFGEEEAEDSDDYEDMDSDEEEGEDEEEDSDDDEDEDEMNGEVIGGNFNEEPGNDSGCTAVVALIRGNKLYVANAGDSRCIVCREGKAIEMSADHKPEDLPEMERIEKAGGNVTPDGRVNGGLNLSRALGDHAYKTNKSLPLTEQMISPVPDIKTLELDPKLDSYVFLACDGIWNSLSSQETVDFINERLTDAKDAESPEFLKKICIELFEHCLSPDTMGDGTGCDNMTAVLVKLKPQFAKTSAESASEGSTVSSKRQATDNEEDDKQESKKLKLEDEDSVVKEEKTSSTAVDAASS